MSHSTSDSSEMSPSVPQDSNYPPQRHAGAVGLGPEFGKGAPISEKIDGLKQEIKGKLKHDPKFVEHGRDKRTGQLKRKEMGQDLGQPGQTRPNEEKHQQEHADEEQPGSEMIGRSEDK